MSSEPLPITEFKRHANHNQSRQRYTCLIVLTLTFFALFLLLIGGVYWLRAHLLNRLSPDEITALRDSETRFITPPEHLIRQWKSESYEDQEFVRTLGQDLVDLEKRYDALLQDKGTGENPLGLYYRWKYDMPAVADSQRTSYSLLLYDLQPILDRLTSAGKSKVPLGNHLFEIGGNTRKEFFQLMQTIASDDAATGNYSIAIQHCLLPLEFICCQPMTYTINRAWLFHNSPIVFNNAYYFASTWKDPSALRSLLTALNLRNSLVHSYDPETALYGDSLILLLRFKEAGVPVDLKPQTLSSYSRQSLWSDSPSGINWILKNVPSESTLHKDASKRQAIHANSRLNSSAMYVDHLLRVYVLNQQFPGSFPNWRYRILSGLLGFELSAYYYSRFGYSHQDRMTVQYNNQLVRYDLTRLRIAQQLALVEGKMDEATSPSASSQIVKEYLDPVPYDPWTSAPYKISQSGQFYSVGPDKRDDGASILSSEASSGDIFLAPRARHPQQQFLENL